MRLFGAIFLAESAEDQLTKKMAPKSSIPAYTNRSICKYQRDAGNAAFRDHFFFS